MLKLGIISDTHDNVPAIKKAVAYFNTTAVELVIHAGDYVSPFSFKPLRELSCEFVGVWGNNDGDKLALTRVSEGKIKDSFVALERGGSRILVGHYFEALEALAKSQVYDLIVYGHTHEAEIRREGKTLIVNPGECGGWLYGKSTVALVDLDSKEAQLVSLDQIP